MKQHAVEVRIPAVITLRGKAAGETPAKAKKAAEAEAKKLAHEFTERPVLEGKWPEVLGGATVTATAAEGAKPAVDVDG